MNFTQKETDLLKDLTDGEKLCREKYRKYSETAVDPQLKNLCTDLSNVEAGHYNILTELGTGTLPKLNGGTKPAPTFTANYNNSTTPDKENDAYLCSDLLSMEKHISHLYDTCIFEFENEDVRRLLSDIQNDEQDHGKLIYDYMNTNCMYN